MNISFFETDNAEQKYLKKALSSHTLTFDKQPLTVAKAKKIKNTEVISVFVFSEVTKDIIDALPKLKCITTRSTGYNHIDVAYAKSKGIAVCTVPRYGQNTVAEHAFGLLQTLNRHLVEAVTRTRNCDFDFTGLQGKDLAGKTLGVVGTGAIGQYMIKYAKAFDMKVIASDAYPNKLLAKKLGFQYVTLKTLCKQSDFITLHLPLLESTRHIIGKEEFALMKKGVLLINTSRGPLVDTQELIKALDKGLVGGAALDVLEYEKDIGQEAQLSVRLHHDSERLCTLVQNNSLLHRPNVIVTPHLAFYTQEAVERILATTVKNIKGCISKRYVNKV